MTSIPGKRECAYILEMLESGLIDWSYLQPWADERIVALDSVPSWLCDVATKRHRGDLAAALRERIFAEPFEAEAAPDLEKFHVGCLWLRYERREISWATFLRAAGDHLDAAGGDWPCETPYHYLNVLEDAYFTEESERRTREAYLAEHDLAPWIALAREEFEPFRKARRADKAAPRKP